MIGLERNRRLEMEYFIIGMMIGAIIVAIQSLK